MGIVWRCFQFLDPLLRDLNGVLVGVRVLVAEPQRMSVLDQGRDVMWVGGVDHIEKELPVGEVGDCALLWEELGEIRLRHHLFD